MDSRLRELVQPALFEAVFVVLGVVRALAANEWREARQQRQQAETALAEIVAELQANREAAVQSLRYHRALMDTLRSYRSSGQRPDVGLFSGGFISPAQVYNTAWTSASETGALSHMDYADVLRLSRVYALQEAYSEQTHSTVQIIYGELYRGGIASILENHRNFASVISAFVFREQSLLEVYDSTLATVAPAREPRIPGENASEQ